MVNIVVKNTFLDVRHGETDESCAARKRCQSLPREWTPGAANISQWHFRYAIGMSVAAPSVLMSAQTSLPWSDRSPRSDSSFYSAKESSEDQAWSFNLSDPCARSLEGSHADSCDWAEDQDDVARCPSMEFTCATPSFSRSSSGYLCLEEDVVTVPSMQFASVTPTSPLCVCNSFEQLLCGEEDVAACPSMPFQCSTPTSAQGHVCPEESGAAGPSMQFKCSPASFSLPVYSLDSAGNLCQQSLSMCPVWQQAQEQQEPENEPATSMDACTTRTSPQSQALAFQATPKDASMDAVVSCLQMVPQAPAVQPTKDARMDAVVSCLHMALVSCGRLRDIKIDRDSRGMSSTWLSAELLSGPCASARSYEVMKLVKQSLDAIIERLHTLTLLSSRVQREDWGYSLRCSIAYLPSDALGSMCWDMFRKGHCPRHGQCRWYHPQDSDISRLKVTVRNGEASNEEKLQKGSPDKKHKISLGELVH